MKPVSPEPRVERHDGGAGDDAALKAALRTLPAPAAEVEALTRRVLQQWHDGHGRRDAASVVAVGGARLALLGLQASRRRLWLGAASLAAVAVLATTLMLTRPDPALEELMQPDVLSELAIGEM